MEKEGARPQTVTDDHGPFMGELCLVFSSHVHFIFLFWILDEKRETVRFNIEFYIVL